MMSLMFSKKHKILDTTEVPSPPNLDQIIEDLDASKPDDIVFTTDVGLINVEEIVHKSHLENTFKLPRRFENKEIVDSESCNEKVHHADDNLAVSQNKDSLYENVIEYNQNVEKLTNLSQSLPQVLNNLNQIKEELDEDKNRVTDTYKEALKLYHEANTKELQNQK